MTAIAETHLQADKQLTIVGFGGVGALDLYTPYGEMGPVTTEGAKEVWANWADELPDLLARDDVEQHIGGNVFNALALLATRHADVRLAGVIGEEGQVVSDRIRERMAAWGIADHTFVVQGYDPRISKITRRAPGSDRIVYGRKRESPIGRVTTEYIREITLNADVTVVSSVNDTEALGRIFANIPASTFLTFSPSSTELRDARGLLDVMTKRRPDLLTGNNDELAKLLRMPTGTSPAILTEMASAYAKNVLCTLGKDGMILRTADGVRTQISAYLLGEEEIVDTLGTGDRATAEVTDGLIRGEDPTTILARAVRSTAEVARHTGAHGDLYSKAGNTALSTMVER